MQECPSAQEVADTFQSNYGLVVSVAIRFAPTPELVYDVVHQAFVEFMESAMRGHWVPSRDPAPLLYRITKNTAANLWRRERQYSTEVTRMISEKLMQSPDERTDETSEATCGAVKALKGCMGELNAKSREMIEQHYLHDISLERIAERLSVPSNSLRKTLFRIRIKLRDCITRKLNDVR